MLMRAMTGFGLVSLLGIFALGCTERSAAPAEAPAADDTQTAAAAEPAQAVEPGEEAAGGDEAEAHGDHGHDHDHDFDPNAVLQLNDGEKWATDEALRAGMAALRDEIAASIEDIHHDRFSAEQYASLASRVETHLNSIVENCELPPDADVQLHILLAGLFTGKDAMKEGEARKEGAVRILQNLETYPAFFDHPDWKPIEH